MSDLCLICLERAKYSSWYECCQCKNYVCINCGRNGGYLIYNLFVCSMNCMFNVVKIDAYSMNYFSVYDLHSGQYITDYIKKEQMVIWDKAYANTIDKLIDEYIIKDLHKIIIDFL